MTGKDFLTTIQNLEACITMLNISLSMNDGGKLALTDVQQEEIRSYLNDYRRLLLENDVN